MPLIHVRTDPTQRVPEGDGWGVDASPRSWRRRRSRTRASNRGRPSEINGISRIDARGADQARDP